MKLTRRKLMALTPLTLMAAAYPSSRGVEGKISGQMQRALYRRKLIRALSAKKQLGEIGDKDYRRILAASLNPGFMKCFIDDITDAAKVAGDWVDNLQEWLSRLYEWLIENWDVVLRIALSLLMFL